MCKRHEEEKGAGFMCKRHEEEKGAGFMCKRHEEGNGAGFFERRRKSIPETDDRNVSCKKKRDFVRKRTNEVVWVKRAEKIRERQLARIDRLGMEHLQYCGKVLKKKNNNNLTSARGKRG